MWRAADGLRGICDVERSMVGAVRCAGGNVQGEVRNRYVLATLTLLRVDVRHRRGSAHGFPWRRDVNVQYVLNEPANQRPAMVPSQHSLGRDYRLSNSRLPSDLVSERDEGGVELLHQLPLQVDGEEPQDASKCIKDEEKDVLRPIY